MDTDIEEISVGHRVKASIVIPAYNAACFIKETLSSVLSQCNETVEVIVVDDGSTDETLATIRSYGDRVRCIHQKNSGGAASPRNAALSIANGEIVFFFDSDDLMKPGKISATLAIFEQNPAIGLVFTNFDTIDSTGRSLNVSFLKEYSTIREISRTELAHYILESEFAYRRLASENFIGTSGVAVRRTAIDEVGFFDANFCCGEDWDMWLRISRKFCLAYLPMVLHSYRRHNGNITASDPHRTICSQIAMLTKHLNSSSDASVSLSLRTLIAERNFSLAYVLYRCGRMTDARDALRQAAAGISRIRIALAWLKTLLGVRNVMHIKKKLGDYVA